MTFYLVINPNTADEQCVDKGPVDNFTNNMQVDCSQDVGVPADATFKRSLNVRCGDDVTPAEVRRKP
jgi:hypothetical protein